MAEDGPITVASAVVVPEGTPEYTIKRRTSSSTVDGIKRPQLDNSSVEATTTTTETGARGDSGGDGDQTQAGGEAASTTRKRKLLGEDEVREQERKRGQRLFGALLGTIGKFQQDSQSARARAGASRRKEVEEKLQQKLRQQNEELDEKKRRESNILREKMQQEQKLFEERSLELRHANLRARANYLCTKAKPSLYYLPWKLTSEEKVRIREQLDDAEATIQRERSEFQRRRAQEEEDERRHRESQANESTTTTTTTTTTNTDNPHAAPSSPDFERRRGKVEGRDDPDTVMRDNDDDVSRDKQNTVSVNPSNGEHVNANVSAPATAGRDHERRRSDVTSHDGGDIVIEAGEDTVIY